MSKGFLQGLGSNFNYKPKAVPFYAAYGYKRGSEILHKEFTFPCVRNKWEQVLAEHTDKPLSDTSHTLLPDNYKQLNTQLQLYPFF